MTRPMIRPLTALATAALIALAPSGLSAQEAAIYSSMDAVHPVWAKSAMVSVQEAVAAEVGLQVLKDGGNAVDAAIATGFALAVTLPRAGNLGGGGFMMIHLTETGETRASTTAKWRRRVRRATCISMRTANAGQHSEIPLSWACRRRARNRRRNAAGARGARQRHDA
jgi:hypothetical protein